VQDRDQGGSFGVGHWWSLSAMAWRMPMGELGLGRLRVETGASSSHRDWLSQVEAYGT
jgi:hypothetical protein